MGPSMDKNNAFLTIKFGQKKKVSLINTCHNPPNQLDTHFFHVNFISTNPLFHIIGTTGKVFLEQPHRKSDVEIKAISMLLKGKL